MKLVRFLFFKLGLVDRGRVSAVFRNPGILSLLALLLSAEASATLKWSLWEIASHYGTGRLAEPTLTVEEQLNPFLTKYLTALTDDDALAVINEELTDTDLQEAVSMDLHFVPFPATYWGTSPTPPQVKYTLMTVAAARGWKTVVDRLLQCSAYEGEDAKVLGTTALHEAVKNFHWQLIPALSHQGYNLFFEKDSSGRIPLIAAVGTRGYLYPHDRFARYEVTSDNKNETVNSLLKEMSAYPQIAQRPEIKSELFHILELPEIAQRQPVIYKAIQEKITLWNLVKDAPAKSIRSVN